MLRMGDVTLIDLKTASVAGIGELKGRQGPTPNRLDISLVFTGPKSRLKVQFPNEDRGPETVLGLPKGFPPVIRQS